MIGKLLKLVGGGRGLSIYGAILAIGISLGGIGVHKLYQISQNGQMRAEISRMQEQSDERIQLAQDSAQRAIDRANSTAQTIIEVEAHVTNDPACSLGPDALRLLNNQRQ